MPENAPQNNDKTRRSRSLGSFMVFLLVVFFVLLVMGGKEMRGVEQLSQDRYEWHLNQGDIVSQRMRGNEKGTNKISGIYRKTDEGEVPFEVTYTSIEGREAEFRELKARQYDPTSPRDLIAGIEQGWYEPLEARYLTGFRAPQPVAGQGDEERPAAASARPPERREKLLVTVLDRGQAPGSATPGDVYFDVQLGDGRQLDALLATLESTGVPVERKTYDLTEQRGTRWEDSSSLLGSILVYLGPMILVMVIFMLVLRQMRSQGGAGGVMSFGRSRAQLYSKESHTNVTFDDVAGANEAKAEVREIVEFLKNPSRFTRIGGRIPRGVLLVGSPGCGKTLLAKAIAGEAEVPFFSISGSDFVEMFVGVGASRVRDLFKQARENSPCIIFLDEIDAVGRRRGSGMGGGHDEREQTLNAILVEMDGFGTDEGIIVIAATNRPDVLDPALLRPGRFDREVTIDLPDIEGREAILRVHLKRVKHAAAVDVSVLARSTPGYSGADLAAIINEAAIGAVLAKREEVTMDDLEEARDKVRYGRQKLSRKVEEEDREITAYHEAGHAVVASVLPKTDRPHKVTIVPRGRALGATMVLPAKESYHMQKQKLESQLAVLFGGRVAEELFCGDISAGASDDIRRATDLARAMVAELGMSEKIGPINYAERQGSDFLGTELMRGKIHSEETAREIDEEVHRILSEAHKRSRDIVNEHRGVVESIARGLLRFETINGEEIGRLLEGASLEELRPEPPAPPPGEPTPRPRERDRQEGGSTRSKELPGSPGLSPA